MQASIFKLWIFSICVRGESSVTLESCGSLVKIPGYFEGASLHCVQKEPCQSLCSDLDTFVQCLKSDGKNWGQIRCLSCSPGNLSKIFNSCIFWRAQCSWNVSSGQGGSLSDSHKNFSQVIWYTVLLFFWCWIICQWSVIFALTEVVNLCFPMGKLHFPLIYKITFSFDSAEGCAYCYCTLLYKFRSQSPQAPSVVSGDTVNTVTGSKVILLPSPDCKINL